MVGLHPQCCHSPQCNLSYQDIRLSRVGHGRRGRLFNFLVMHTHPHSFNNRHHVKHSFDFNFFIQSFYYLLTGKGNSVDITNSGCLSESGRGSVYIPASPLAGQQFCLVKTQGDNACSCQNEGMTFTATGFCAVLDPSYESYRFIMVSDVCVRCKLVVNEAFGTSKHALATIVEDCGKIHSPI